MTDERQLISRRPPPIGSTPAANPEQYAELLAPRDARGFTDACAFVAQLAEAGVNVEVTAVARPDVNVAQVEALANGLGARSFRTRSWIGDKAEHG